MPRYLPQADQLNSLQSPKASPPTKNTGETASSLTQSPAPSSHPMRRTTVAIKNSWARNCWLPKLSPRSLSSQRMTRRRTAIPMPSSKAMTKPSQLPPNCIDCRSSPIEGCQLPCSKTTSTSICWIGPTAATSQLGCNPRSTCGRGVPVEFQRCRSSETRGRVSAVSTSSQEGTASFWVCRGAI